MPKLLKMTCLTYAGAPKDVRLAMNIAPEITVEPVVRRVFLISVPRTVPTPAQVLDGVQYGNEWGPNKGIEFTGEYSLGAAVYPAEDDVRNGVDYGPTGADYDGDLVLPVQADVKLGVTYGADGTEYTGTYGGGGGGASRVIGSPVVRRIG